MAKERLSKLQLNILEEMYKKRYVFKSSLKVFYNKRPGDTWENSERVTIHKSLNNLVSKGLVSEYKNNRYCLTENGFEVLKANKNKDIRNNVNFKAYIELLKEEVAFFNRQQAPSLAEKSTFITDISNRWSNLITQ